MTIPVIRRTFPAAVAILLALLAPLSFAAAPAGNPALVARPQGAKGDVALTTLDEKTAFARSQDAIGRQVGDFVLLNREGKPVELAGYRGKPLLVNFIYTACFRSARRQPGTCRRPFRTRLPCLVPIASTLSASASTSLSTRRKR